MILELSSKGKGLRPEPLNFPFRAVHQELGNILRTVLVSVLFLAKNQP